MGTDWWLTAGGSIPGCWPSWRGWPRCRGLRSILASVPPSRAGKRQCWPWQSFVGGLLLKWKLMRGSPTIARLCAGPEPRFGLHFKLPPLRRFPPKNKSSWGLLRPDWRSDHFEDQEHLQIFCFPVHLLWYSYQAQGCPVLFAEFHRILSIFCSLCTILCLRSLERSLFCDFFQGWQMIYGKFEPVFQVPMSTLFLWLSTIDWIELKCKLAKNKMNLRGSSWHSTNYIL